MILRKSRIAEINNKETKEWKLEKYDYSSRDKETNAKNSTKND